MRAAAALAAGTGESTHTRPRPRDTQTTPSALPPGSRDRRPRGSHPDRRSFRRDRTRRSDHKPRRSQPPAGEGSHHRALSHPRCRYHSPRGRRASHHQTPPHRTPPHPAPHHRSPRTHAPDPPSHPPDLTPRPHPPTHPAHRRCHRRCHHPPHRTHPARPPPPASPPIARSSPLLESPPQPQRLAHSHRAHTPLRSHPRPRPVTSGAHKSPASASGLTTAAITAVAANPSIMAPHQAPPAAATQAFCARSIAGSSPAPSGSFGSAS